MPYQHIGFVIGLVVLIIFAIGYYAYSAYSYWMGSGAG